MKIGLVDCDSHNFPNLPLMKISSYHKNKGDTVEFASLGSHYERLYASKIFTESQDSEMPGYDEIFRMHGVPEGPSDVWTFRAFSISSDPCG